MNTAPFPKVSVLLPTYNGNLTIVRAIRSVIGQSFTDWELLVIDDGSTDGTAASVEELSRADGRIRLVRNDRNSGIQRTLNHGLREAKGTYVARIDDDDAWADPAKLARQVAFLDAHPAHVLVGTGTVVVDEADRELYRFLAPATDKDIRSKMLFRNCFTHSSVMFRKETVLKEGGYDENASSRHVEDYDLWLRLGRVGQLANLPFHAVRFTLRPGNLSSKNKLEQFSKDIELVRKYGGDYPGYPAALAWGHLRLYLYRAWKGIPAAQLKTWILKRYKSG
jgi:glycosyltransferase involved in cell wall biosynthesis